MRDRQFSSCCPFASLPTIACVPTTEIQSGSIRYLHKLLQALGDDQEHMLPDSYKIDELTTEPRAELLVEIDKCTIHLFDGDGGQV